MAPGDDHADGGQGQHVEQREPHRDGIDGLGQVPHRVAGFGGGGADHLKANEGEEGDLEARQETQGTVGEETTIVPQICDLRGVPTWGDETASQQPGRHDDQRTHRDQLDQGEPELGLAEQVHRDHVQGE